MARISTKFDEFALLLKEREFNELDLDPKKEYEFKRVKEGVWVLTEAEAQKLPPQPAVKKEKSKQELIDERIFKLIRTKPLKDRVEKRFEKLLNKEELERFKQLLKEGKIVPFKLSEKYKRAIYKSREEVERGRKSAEISSSVNDFERRGFALLEEPSAIVFSQKNAERIKSGEILGVKSFDRKYCVIARNVFAKYSEKILNYLKQNNNVSLEEIVEDTHLAEELARIICELLKEKGEILEKRKGIYQYIG